MDFEQEINALKTTVQTQAEFLQLLTTQLEEEIATRKLTFLEAAPVGTIAAFGGANFPAGWLLCNGQSFAATQFPQLAAAIGSNWGGEGGAGRFNVPDLGGMFLRGVDREGSFDPDRDRRAAIKPGGNTGGQVGSRQSDDLRSHNHGISDPGHSHGYNTLTHTGGPDIAGGIHCARFDDNRFRTTASGTGISINHAGGSETRPVNAYVHFMIKADSQTN